MEIKQISYPAKGAFYLKKNIQREEKGILMQCGTAVFNKGEEFPYKSIDFHEISYLLSGKLEVEIKSGEKKIMNAGDLIYLNKDEVRQSKTLEDSKLLFFLVKDI